MIAQYRYSRGIPVRHAADSGAECANLGFVTRNCTWPGGNPKLQTRNSILSLAGWQLETLNSKLETFLIPDYPFVSPGTVSKFQCKHQFVRACSIACKITYAIIKGIADKKFVIS